MASQLQTKSINLLMYAAIVAIFGGIIALILTPILSGFVGIGSIIVSVILLIALLWMGMKTKLAKISVFNLIVLLFAVGLVGTIVTMFVPAASAFILSLAKFDVQGLVLTLVYIGLVEITLKKLGYGKVIA